MKIDIHMHTKKVKTGDAVTRNITPKKFSEILKRTNVSICAITNHNCFDKIQYLEILKEIDNTLLVWPGIELDIKENGSVGHLLVIVNPCNVDNFAERINSLISGIDPDTFSMQINDVATNFDWLDPIYIPHYYNKKPNITNDLIDTLSETVKNKKRIIKEATNSISAGIFVSHGHKTIYGSDIHDWDLYESFAKDLPDLRLPVETYEQFCLLLERNDSTIETILNKKKNQSITVKPFVEDPAFPVKIWDDINVFFGSKGTGKTKILEAISQYFNENGHQTSVFDSNATNLNKNYDINGSNFQLNTDDLPIDLCKQEFTRIRTAKDNNVTSIRKYFDFYSVVETSKIANLIKVRDFSPHDIRITKIKLDNTTELKKKLFDFNEFIQSNDLYKEVIGEELFIEFASVIDKVINRISMSIENDFIDYQSATLFNHFIAIFSSEISKKTGRPEKPTTTGFTDYASNRIEIEVALNKIIKNMGTKIPEKADFVWDFEDKGKLFCKTILLIQDGNVVDSNYRHLNSNTKNPEKHVAKKIKEISEVIYEDSLFEKINEFNTIDGGRQVKSIDDLILFRRFFELNFREYQPSNGESAMILLAKELSSDKETFIIDEPEKSLGNDYISNYIVPLLKELAYRGKRIIIATHDANIAVRTLPYNSIYREHDVDGNRTYYGNPFSNNLVCSDQGKKLDWKEESMRILEGGKEAFGERGKIYGKA